MNDVYLKNDGHYYSIVNTKKQEIVTARFDSWTDAAQWARAYLSSWNGINLIDETTKKTEATPTNNKGGTR